MLRFGCVLLCMNYYLVFFFLAAIYPAPTYITPTVQALPADNDVTNTTVSPRMIPLAIMCMLYMHDLLLHLIFYCRYLLVVWTLMWQRMNWGKSLHSLGSLFMLRYHWVKAVVLYSLVLGMFESLSTWYYFAILIMFAWLKCWILPAFVIGWRCFPG